jgi:hypothetical protein
LRLKELLIPDLDQIKQEEQGVRDEARGRFLPPCRDLPPIESTAAPAEGTITPGEAGRTAAMVDTFIQAIETSDFEQRLQHVEESFARREEASGAAGIWTGRDRNL